MPQEDELEQDLAGNPSAVTYDARTLQRIIEYCEAEWGEANRAPPSEWPTPEMHTGRKMAFNNVRQYARLLLGEPT